MTIRRLSLLFTRIERRLEGEQGFTLVELMIVLLTLGILLTVAVPSYLTLKDKASKSAAKQDVSQVFRAVQSYNADNFPGSKNDPSGVATDTGFDNVSLQALTKYDTSIDAAASLLVVDPVGFTRSPTDVCLTATVGRWTAAQHGLNGPISIGTAFLGSTCTAS
ncbi:MAG: type secretion system protein [Actinomycetia bacterium]|nr:type secretion system protein [Actinomycetes bacterium]